MTEEDEKWDVAAKVKRHMGEDISFRELSILTESSKSNAYQKVKKIIDEIEPEKEDVQEESDRSPDIKEQEWDEEKDISKPSQIAIAVLLILLATAVMLYF